MKNRIVVFSVPGNFYSARDYCNINGLAKWVVQFQFTGNNTMVILKIPQAEYDRAVRDGVLRGSD